ncbi:unnamed protein product [Ixodes pacificus]
MLYNSGNTTQCRAMFTCQAKVTNIFRVGADRGASGMIIPLTKFCSSHNGTPSHVVSLPMHVQSHFLRERPSTGLALVRPLSRVNPLVTPQVRLPRKCPPAHAAHKRLFSRVYPLVILQSIPLRKCLLADWAHERPLARVQPFVPQQVCLLRKRFPAEAAAEGLLPSVRPFVIGDVRRFMALERAVTALIPVSLARPVVLHIRSVPLREVALVVNALLFVSQVCSGNGKNVDKIKGKEQFTA